MCLDFSEFLIYTLLPHLFKSVQFKNFNEIVSKQVQIPDAPSAWKVALLVVLFLLLRFTLLLFSSSCSSGMAVLVLWRMMDYTGKFLLKHSWYCAMHLGVSCARRVPHLSNVLPLAEIKLLFYQKCQQVWFRIYTPPFPNNCSDYFLAWQ